jgi:carboxypeptidase Taq
MKNNSPKNSNYELFKTHLAKVADIGFAGAVLGWDQQTLMPRNGAEFRGQQMATLSTLGHEVFVDPKFGELLERLSEDSTLSEDERINVTLTRKDYLRKKKYPHAFVEEYAKVTSGAFTQWHDARGKNQFNLFEPLLEKLVELKRTEANFLGYEDHPYDALIEDYEPGLTTKKIDEVFTEVKRDLFPFIKTILGKTKIDASCLHKLYPQDKQRKFAENAIRQMGYDFNSGRADHAPHPFCTTFGPGDVRITIRGEDHFFNPLLFAAIHEAGHGLYELGLPLKEQYGMPLGSAVSLAFHESQSRFWENNIGRSENYWQANYSALQAEFPENLKSVPRKDFYRAINLVEPSFIRVEADELTYHAHIYIRYLIEKALIEKQIQAADIPAYWNDRYEEFLGIRPKDDAEGCLQDVHWSYGSFGYFPTYSFGSFYAAQLGQQMKKDLPSYDSLVSGGDLAPVLGWLREKVHVHGRKYNSSELLKRITGEELQFKYFMDYAKAKFGAVYGI